jgi:hypothetical protein
MKTTRWQFSLRQLLLVMTIVAIAVILVSHPSSVFTGLATLFAGLTGLFQPVIGTFAKDRQPTTGWLPRKPMQKDIQGFVVPYPKRFRM